MTAHDDRHGRASTARPPVGTSRQAAKRLGTIGALGLAAAVGATLAVTGAPLAASAQGLTPAASQASSSQHALRTAHGASSSASCGPITPAYVEVNNDDLVNVGDYTLEDGSTVFDVAIIFAANINYDGEKAQLHFNDRVQETLDEAQTQIRPLQEKGIKVTLSVLGNHQGAGLANFESRSDAEDFAEQVSDAVDEYDLDGVDLDDEYSEYGENGTAEPNDDSIGWLIDALREDMPNKIVSYYNIGPSSESLQEADPEIGSELTYATNPYYGTYSAPQIPGLGDERLSPAAVDIQNTDTETSATLAQRTVDDDYGVFMTYNLPGGDQSEAISAFTQKLVGQDAQYDADAEHDADAATDARHAAGTCSVSLDDGVLHKTRTPGQNRPGHHRPGHHGPGHHKPGHHKPGHHKPGHHGNGHQSHTRS